MSNKTLVLLSKYNQSKEKTKALADALNKNRNEILEVLGIRNLRLKSKKKTLRFEITKC